MTPRRALALAVLGMAALTGLFVYLGARLGSAPRSGDAVARGREAFWGRGRCASCHPLSGEGGGIRCPDLGLTAEGPFAARAAARVAGLSAAAYVVQSLYEPDAFRVPDYPAGLMPAAHLAPIGLDERDVAALTAFLLDSPGAERAALREAERRARPAAARPDATRAGDASAGYGVFERMRCGACHLVEGITPPEDAGVVARRGPDLTGIGAIQGRAYLEESILDPDAVVVPGEDRRFVSDDGHSSRMPTYADNLSADDVADLVAFLETL